jgi:uncharacterized protein with HEPN domain
LPFKDPEHECPGDYPEIDKKGYRGMGNILRHSYHRVNDEIVWSTVKEDLPALKNLAESILKGLTEKQSEDAPNFGS